ncbi:Crooked neck-like protein 1 [Trichinella nativa]|uniref:Crooked neck-like protein 1 n=1 Tax=Trichinella nativa TaxID=6335 RepID=A0A0V1KXK3_9BILA|nr:Crooked neck-like protein 1 [Trichinella nativa]
MSLYCNIMQSNAQDSLTRLAKKAMKLTHSLHVFVLRLRFLVAFSILYEMSIFCSVKNKAPAPIQITAEQLLREAKERDLEILPPPPKKKISDPEELKEYQFRRRKEYEDCIRKNRNSICNWIKYAKWEESQGEMQRSRSVFERALDVDHRNITLWLQYAEMEIRNRQINHARNVWDRAISILPRAIQFWLKYTYMEEMLGNIPGTRQVFERWMEWEPGEQAWNTYINFEMRYKEVDRARNIWQRFINVHPDPKNWIRYAKFEQRQKSITNARMVFERAVEYFGLQHINENILIAFAKFEENQKEHDRARVIYKYALDNLPKDKLAEIQKAYAIHEKKYGEKFGIEHVIVGKRRRHYEEELEKNSFNYDAWFDYLRLLESEQCDADLIRDTYERAVSNVPPKPVKIYWKRYIYLWINYAVYEELEANDMERAREVYKMCLEVIPHKKFTFAKYTYLHAVNGNAIGRCPKEKLFREYIDLELRLREFDRCRILYGKLLEFCPENCASWIKYAELETLLGDTDRARAIYDLAISWETMDMPEILWKSYIDFEIGQGEYGLARKLYKRLLSKTQQVKVWISFARFELSVEDDGNVGRARSVYQEANRALQNCESKEERVLLLQTWREFEKEHGDADSLNAVESQMPKRVKKRRKAFAENGTEIGWEEYYDYIFPADEAGTANLKLLALAKMWKKQQQTVVVQDDSEPTCSKMVEGLKRDHSAANSSVALDVSEDPDVDIDIGNSSDSNDSDD